MNYPCESMQTPPENRPENHLPSETSTTTETPPRAPIPTTLCIAKRLESKGISLDDILKLHQFGMLGALPVPNPTVAGLQIELDAAYPDNTPGVRQVLIYRLAMALIDNKPSLISSFIAPRAYYPPKKIYGEEPDSQYRAWFNHRQAANPYKNTADYQGDSEPRPRLIDRMQPVGEARACEYLEILQQYLSPKRYHVLYQRLQGMSFTDIAESAHCSRNNITDMYHRIINKLYWRHRPSTDLLQEIFGPEELGKICETPAE